MPPIIIAITALEGMPSVQHRNERGLRGGVVGCLRRGHALDHAGAEFLRRARQPLLHRVGRERGQHRAAAGQDAEQPAQERAAQDGPHGSLEILLSRPQPAHLRADEIAALGVGQVGHDLGDAEHAHDQRHEADAVEQIADAERVARVAGVDVGADQPQQHAEEDHAQRLDDRAARQHDGEDEAQRHQREIVRRRELLGELGQRRRGHGDRHRCHAAGEEGADGGNGERRPGAALACHLVAVETGDDRARLARQVDQDGRGRATVLGAVVDAGQHDERTFGRQEVGGRQQQRHGRHRADARQHADGRADDGTHQAPEQVLQRHRDRKAQPQVVQ